MNIGIIGGGSLGLLLSSYLVRCHNVTLYVKRELQRNNIEKYGLSLKVNDVHKQIVKLNVALIDQLHEHDIYFVCVKQPQIDDVLVHLKRIDHKCSIIFLQNGMGHLKKITSLVSPIYVGAVEHGATRISDYEVNHLGMGTIKLASFSSSANHLDRLQQSLHHDHFPFEVHDDWESLLKYKLLINAVINPLTALFNVPNGSILSNPYLNQIAKQLSNETANVLTLDKLSAWDNVCRVAENTKQNTSSMRSDILHRRETEIEAISGYVLQKAKQDEQVPFTLFVFKAILALQEGEETL